MKILFATGEAFPFIKTGGLGDVSYSLPKALVQKEKLDVRVILPKYSKISNELLKDARHLGHKEIWVAHHNEYVGIEEVELEGVIYYFVDNERYFRRLNVYGEYDDCERFLFFSKAVVETMDITDFKPDIIHCNDWQTALIPIYLKERGIYDVKTVFSIHNLRFQGFFYNNVIEDLLEIDRAKYFQDDGIKYYDMISFLKAGVVYSDYITTVSDSYAEEIKTPEFGEGIHGLFQKYDYKLSGIVNGIDKTSYPLSKKSHKTLKANLQAKLGLEIEEATPLVAIITRLDRQKGLDFILEKFDEMMSLGIQFVLLGTGEKSYEDFFRYKESQYRGYVCSYIGFNQELSTEIYAGADIFLMPSVFEPCGLSQMMAMRYGTLPLVHEVGGLRDTVQPFNPIEGTGTGFSFDNLTSYWLNWALQTALDVYYNHPDVWKKLQVQAMECDFSWDTACQSYLDLYHSLAN